VNFARQSVLDRCADQLGAFLHAGLKNGHYRKIGIDEIRAEVVARDEPQNAAERVYLENRTLRRVIERVP
jgi:hypothetical protein